MSNNSSRYIYDTLYGEIQLDGWPWKNEINGDFWEFFTSPELQRLREVRLCNINSLYLPGGANIDRFEHALGTYYLAKECLKTWPALNKVTPEEKKYFLIAALLHDFKTSAFGHSVQYIEEKEGFRHEGDFFTAIRPGITTPIEPENNEKNSSYQYNFASTDPVYFGRGSKLNTLLEESQLKWVGDLIQGDRKLGPLISSDMDLDNIDNVFRLAYHIGITDDCETPLKLAQALYIEDGQKVIPKDAISLIKKWRKVRKELYQYLLLNPGEFSGKCMLTEAVAFAKRQDYNLTWNKVDRELISSLNQRPNYQKDDLPIYQFSIKQNNTPELEETQDIPPFLLNSFEDENIDLSEDAMLEKGDKDNEWIVDKNDPRFLLRISNNQIKVYREGVESYSIHEITSRLMRGELYGCLAILSITEASLESLDKIYTMFDDIDKRLELGRELSAKLPDNLWDRRIQTRFHAIRDVDKTKRPVSVQTEDGEELKIGKSSQRILLGVFAANRNLTMYDSDHLSNEFHSKLENHVFEFVEGITKEVDSTAKIISLELYGESRNE